MLWELGSLAAAAILCDKETHGKVLGAAGGHCASPLPSSPRGIYGSGHPKNSAAEWQHWSYCLI